MKTVFDYLMKLYRERKQITLLSWFYGTVAVVFVFFAGLCALVNQSFGVAILIVPLVAMVALCANVTVWALVKLAISHIEELSQEETKKEKSETVKKTSKTSTKKSKASKSEQAAK